MYECRVRMDAQERLCTNYTYCECRERMDAQERLCTNYTYCECRARMNAQERLCTTLLVYVESTNALERQTQGTSASNHDSQ